MKQILICLSLYASTLNANELNVERKIELKCIQYKIDCTIAKAILMQESRWKLNAINKRTHDYGIGQINIKIINAKKIDIKRLTTDLNYSLDETFKHLQYFQRRYRHEALWYCRYNVGTASYRKIERRCLSYAAKVQSHIAPLPSVVSTERTIAAAE